MTSVIPPGDLTDLVGRPDTSMMETVLSHLFFHRSLINTVERDVSLSRWLEVAEEVQDGHWLTMVNPLDRCLGLAFQLVAENEMDPWNLDLRRFVELYSEQLRSAQLTHLPSAGMLVLLAEQTLRIKSESALANSQVQDEPDDLDDFYWESDGLMETWEVTFEDEDYEFTSGIIHEGTDVLEPVQLRPANRPVMLVDLLECLEEAQRAAVTMQEEKKDRIKRRDEMKVLLAKSVRARAHKETLEGDIHWSREVLEKLGKTTYLALLNLAQNTEIDSTELFVALLHMTFRGGVKIDQPSFPMGDIHLEMMNEDELAEQREAAEATSAETPAADVPKKEVTEKA